MGKTVSPCGAVYFLRNFVAPAFCVHYVIGYRCPYARSYSWFQYLYSRCRAMSCGGLREIYCVKHNDVFCHYHVAHHVWSRATNRHKFVKVFSGVGFVYDSLLVEDKYFVADLVLSRRIGRNTHVRLSLQLTLDITSKYWFLYLRNQRCNIAQNKCG